MPYPAILGFFGGGEGCHFLRSIVRKKIVVQLRSLRGAVGPPRWDPFWLFCILHSSKHHSRSSAMIICLILGKSIFILLTVWHSEFGIPSQYTGLKIALETTLVSPIITQFGIETFDIFYIKTHCCLLNRHKKLEVFTCMLACTSSQVNY